MQDFDSRPNMLAMIKMTEINSEMTKKLRPNLIIGPTFLSEKINLILIGISQRLVDITQHKVYEGKLKRILVHSQHRNALVVQRLRCMYCCRFSYIFIVLSPARVRC